LLGAFALAIAACNFEEPIEMDLLVQPPELARGATEQLILTTESNMGSGTPVIAIVPADDLQLGEPLKTDSVTVLIDVHANEDAALGSRVVTLTTDNVIATGALEIIEPPPEPATFECEPDVVDQGQNLTVDVTGTSTHFDSTSQIAAVDPTGVAVSNLQVVDSNHASFDAVVDADAPVGSRDLTITTGTEVATGTLIIDYGEPAPSPSISVSPDFVKAGTDELLVVTGENTNFSSATTVAFDPPESVAVISVAFYMEDDVQKLNVHVDVTTDAATGVRDLLVTSPVGEDEEVVSAEVLITPPATAIADPDHGWQGDEDISVDIIGSNTTFGMSTNLLAESGSGVHVGYYSVVNASLIQAIVDIDSDATPGPTSFTITSPLPEEKTENVVVAFTVNELVLVPSIDISPGSGMAGDSPELTVTGTNTNFEDGVTTFEVTEGTGITIDSFTVDSPTQITAQVSLALDAPTNTATLTATTSEEVASDTFQVLAYVETCDDFAVVPDTLRIGSYSASVYLQGEETDWVFGESTVELVEAPDHVFLESCSVSTPTHISCMFTVGLFAEPGEYELHVTTGSETLCGLLTIAGEAITDVTVPTGILPVYATYSGEIDAPAGDPFDYYHVVTEPGDVLVFHAFSLDRVTMDPVLRLIDGTGDDWLAYEDDETPMGIDARLVYYFGDGGDFYVEVGPKLPSCYGPYDLYVYRLSHGAVVSETAADNDTFALAQDVTLAEPGDAVPYAIHGTFSDVEDIDVYEISVDTAVAIDVVARRLGGYAGSTADLTLTVYDASETEVASNSTWYEIPTSADPRVFLDAPGTYYLVVESQEGSWGFYAIDVRHRVVINEVDNRSTTTDPFVELVGPPSFDLAGYEICAYGPDGQPVDESNACIDSGDFVAPTFVTNSFGYVAVYWDDVMTDTLNLPPGAGAIALRISDVTVDSVQYGDLISDIFAEGSPAEVGDSRAIGRGAEVDTNDNWLDFIYQASPSPGQANDRACQAAVPLYGEDEG